VMGCGTGIPGYGIKETGKEAISWARP